MKTNLTCETCEPELIAYLDGQLHAAVARAMEAHVASCVRCRVRLESYRAIGSRLTDLAEIDPPAWLEARVLDQVTGRARLHRLLSRGVAGAAAFSFAATVGLFAALPQIARQLGLPDPTLWPVAVLRAVLEGAVGATKRLAHELSVYEPIARQIWSALQTLETIPRIALLTLRSSEAQIAVALAFTLGVAVYFALRPSRTRQGGIGHACLTL